MIKNISNLGDAAVYCDFGVEVNEKINSNVIIYFNHLKNLINRNKIDGIINLTPSYNKLIISFDLNITNFSKIKNLIQNLNITNNLNIDNQKIEIPVCCDDEYALDFDRLIKKLNLTKDEILKNYFSKEYFCYMTGFIAGMPFLGNLNEKIRCERLETPRVKVPKGSIGITEEFTNIYTFESPGGWNIIGNTPKKIFKKKNLQEPALIKPGHRIIFYQISKKEYLKYND
ncbi:allophanate hydrolase subunit 1 [Pelagibacteraceae bacterium]|jgi:KipI family sensor histidine kinase inhibitor|nr:allophanate hydrolase subunit 1 [Candidatus Pelagibacter sp.]MDC1485390.1 allophanate hydrolase subunit 1 [Pelagibacteraceae bacterium]|tara:strand:- start:479 stop:1165 length:687 start_codon:yes stop_codon:yes gene_type:complete